MNLLFIVDTPKHNRAVTDYKINTSKISDRYANEQEINTANYALTSEVE